MIVFKNVNKPQQPQRGVYIWYYKKDSVPKSIYVGQAGLKNSPLPNSTLSRGVNELVRGGCISSSKSKNNLDTDFIVGTTIKYYNEKGFECIWEHLTDNPRDEREFVLKTQPILQDKNGRILEKFKKIKSSTGRWDTTTVLVKEAENKIFQLLP